MAKIQQNKYKSCEEIRLDEEVLTQKITICHGNGSSDVFKLDEPFIGFPISEKIINDLVKLANHDDLVHH